MLSMVFCLCSLNAVVGQIPDGDVLPETAPLTIEEPLDVVMVRGIGQFAEQELIRTREKRHQRWNSDNREETIKTARQQLSQSLGFHHFNFKTRSTFQWMDAHADEILNHSEVFSFVRWDVGNGIIGEGIFANPKLKEGRGPLPLVVIVPDSSQTPEMLFGINGGLPEEQQIARRLAEAGCSVLCVATLDRSAHFSGNPNVRMLNTSHREYVYRAGFEVGLHPVGIEAASALAGAYAFTRDQRHQKIAMYGIGDGGLVAMCAGALSPNSINLDAVIVSGYYSKREAVWQEPIDHNIWNQLELCGDAELAALILPKKLLIESCKLPEYAGPQNIEGRASVAAPGKVVPPRQKDIEEEFFRLKSYADQLPFKNLTELITSDTGAFGSQATFEWILRQQFRGELSIGEVEPIKVPFPPKHMRLILLQYQQGRTKRRISGAIDFAQKLLNQSDKERAKQWSTALATRDTAAWNKLAPQYREKVHSSFIGKLPIATAPLNPRSRRVINEGTHVGYEVVLDVIPDKNGIGVIAGGILLIPKDLKPGEKRPVVVCQHGLEGTPMDTITMDESTRPFRAYKGFSTQLVKRGFIVYAPQNPYRGYDEFRVLQRKSNPVGRSLFSYIVEQHRQTLKWLSELPYVDGNRIGFYGLSYGGKTAMRVPELLPPTDDQSGYCLSICSADFNEWIRKNASIEDRYSYIFTPEYEIFEWDMAHSANYAELGYLMAPRPFMVERGHDDGVAPDEWVAWEFAKIRRFYTKLGISDQTEIEWFDGPHTIHGVGTFQFLHRHLKWPAARKPKQ